MKKYFLMLFILGLMLTGCITQPEIKENITSNITQNITNITVQNQTSTEETKPGAEPSNLIYIQPSEIGLSDVFGKNIYGYSLRVSSDEQELVFEGSEPFSNDELNQLEEQVKIKSNNTIKLLRYSKNETFSNFLILKKINYTDLTLPTHLQILFDAVKPEQGYEFMVLNHGNGENHVFLISENWFESNPTYLQNYTEAFALSYRIHKNFTNESAFSMFDNFINKTGAEKTEEYSVVLSSEESLNFTTYVSHFAYLNYTGMLVIETNSDDDRAQITMQVVRFE